MRAVDESGGDGVAGALRGAGRAADLVEGCVVRGGGGERGVLENLVGEGGRYSVEGGGGRGDGFGTGRGKGKSAKGG